MLWFFLSLFAHADSPTKLPLNHVRGKQLYDDLCFQCHGQKALAENEVAKMTGAPALAGKIPSEEYQEAIEVIQAGKGMMPAYEMTIDRHDSKRILMYLSRLDPETGLDPNPQDYEDYEQEEAKNNGKDDEKKSQVQPPSPLVTPPKEKKEEGEQ